MREEATMIQKKDRSDNTTNGGACKRVRECERQAKIATEARESSSSKVVTITRGAIGGQSRREGGPASASASKSVTRARAGRKGMGARA